MYHLYGIQKTINGPLIAKLMTGIQFSHVTALAEFLEVPATIMAKELVKPKPHWGGFLIYEHISGPLPVSLPLTERPYNSERVWPYDMLGNFVKPKDPSKLADALIKGYSYKEAAEVLNTCQPAIKRCARKEFADGVDIREEPGIIEARADEYYFRTRYTVSMPSKIDV